MEETVRPFPPPPTCTMGARKCLLENNEQFLTNPTGYRQFLTPIRPMVSYSVQSILTHTLDDHVFATERRSTNVDLRNVSEAAHLESSIPHPKADVNKNQIAKGGIIPWPKYTNTYLCRNQDLYIDDFGGQGTPSLRQCAITGDNSQQDLWCT